MPYIPTGFVNQQEIEAAVQRAEQALAPTIVRIRSDLGADWTGDPSIFFRIVISDEFAKKPKLSHIAQEVALKLTNEVKTDEFGLMHSFIF